MADKRISQLVERVTLANNDVFPIVASGATTTNKVTLQTIDDYMQTNLDFGVTSVAMTVPTGLSVTGTPITSTGTFVVTFTAGYSIPTTAKQTQWDTAYSNRIVSVTAPITFTSNVLAITQSGTASNGYLSSTDWNTFNSKQNALTFGNLTEATSSVLTITGGTGAVIGSGTSIEVKQASGTQDGFLDSADWTTFNGKQNALSGTGIVKSTGGTITYLTDNTSNWDSAYNDKINSAAVTGTTTKTLTLTQQDGGTITTTWTDLVNPGTVTSVGVSMPSAFSVANSPITSSGTIAITGAGTISQYIDGTGALQTFPSGLPPTGAAGGDLTGTYPNPTVHAVHGIDFQNGIPTADDTWVYGGSPAKWQHQKLHTNQITEDGNLFYTDARARASISESVTGLDYNSATGVFSTTAGYGIPTTASQTNWDAAYNDKINSAAVSGTTTKTLTLTQQDGGTITASWTDINTDAVSSVFGRTGAVVATSGDYNTDQVTEGTSNLYFTNARSRSSITLTTTGTSGAATYNSTTGVLNIPSYVGGVTSVNTLTGAVVLTTSNIAEGTNLYYTDTRARAAISLTTTGTSGAATYSGGVLNIPNYGSALSGYLPLSGGTITGLTTFNYNDSYVALNRGAVTNYIGILYETATTNQWFVGLRELGTNHYYIYNEVLGTNALTIDRTNNNATFGGTLTASNLSGTNTGDQTLAGLGGVPTSRTLTINGTAYDLSANRSWTIDVTGNFVTLDTTQTIASRKTLSYIATTYSGTTQSFLIDGAAGNGALTINAASDYAYLTFAQAQVAKFEIGIEGLTTNKGSLYINPSTQSGSTGASIYVKKSNGFVGIKNIDPTEALHVSGRGIFDGAVADNSPIIRMTGTGTDSFQYFTIAYNPNITAGRTIAHFMGKSSDVKQSGYVGYQWNGNNSDSNFVTLGHYTVDHIVKIYPTREVEFTGNIIGTNIYTNGLFRNRGSSNLVYYSAGTLNVGFGAVIGHGATANRTAYFRGSSVNDPASVWWGYVDSNGNNVPTFAIDAIGTGGASFWNNTAGVGGGTWTNVARVEAGVFKVNDAKLSVQASILGDSVAQIEGSIRMGTWTTAGSRYIGYTRNDDGTWGTAGASGLEMQSVNINGGLYSQNVHIWTHTYNGGSGRRLTVRYDGNVGVATDNPSSTFHVNGTSYIGTMSGFSPAVHIRGAYYGGPRFQLYGLDADGSAWMGLGTDMSSSPFELSIYYPTNGASSVCFGRYSYTDGTRYSGFTATARLSYGGTWTCAGDVVAYGSPSDINYKENVKPIEDALDKILQLEGVSFDWKQGTEINKLTNIKEDLGFIAQQVQGVLPKLVRKNDDGKLSLRDKGIIPYLVEAIKEQQKQIEELKKQIA